MSHRSAFRVSTALVSILLFANVSSGHGGGHGGGGSRGGGHQASATAPHHMNGGRPSSRSGSGSGSASSYNQPVMFPDRLPEARLAHFVHHLFHPHE